MSKFKEAGIFYSPDGTSGGSGTVEVKVEPESKDIKPGQPRRVSSAIAPKTLMEQMNEDSRVKAENDRQKGRVADNAVEGLAGLDITSTLPPEYRGLHKRLQHS